LPNQFAKPVCQTSALAEVLGRNQGPNKLDSCYIDNSVIANGLRGNSRLKSIKPRVSMTFEVGNQELLAIAGALKENKGLVDFDLMYDFMMSNEIWDAICDSLKTHPTLQILFLWSLGAHERALLSPAVIKYRIQAVVDMLKVNLSIHTIRLPDRNYLDHELFRESAVPYLETNRLRPRLRAIQKTIPFAYRAKVLGRALLAVRSDPNRFWMLLSGNAEVAFPATTTTTTLATNLPTPATVDFTVAAIRATSTTGASTVGIVATPASGQKRKTRP
jgi:hypothetical protein